VGKPLISHLSFSQEHILSFQPVICCNNKDRRPISTPVVLTRPHSSLLTLKRKFLSENGRARWSLLHSSSLKRVSCWNLGNFPPQHDPSGRPPSFQVDIYINCSVFLV
jgi:hypothetical protein